MKIVDIIMKFQGIIGAVVGVVVTLVTTQLIKRIGKIYFDFYNWSFEMGKWNRNTGKYEIINEVNQAESGKCFFEVNIYNGFDMPKALKNIKIRFDIGNDKYDYQLENCSTKKYSESGYNIDFLGILNLEPKKMIKLKLECNLKKEDLLNIKNFKTVYFIAQNHKNKKIKKII